MSGVRSRAFLYGESVFTTLRVEQGTAFFAQAHRERLQRSAEWLWPGSSSKVFDLLAQAFSAVPSGEGVWRLTFHQEGPRNGATVLSLDSWWGPGLNAAKPLQLQTCSIVTRSSNWPSFVKTSDYLARTIAARDLPHQSEALFCVDGEIAELMFANIVFLKNQTLVTPSSGPNVLDGIGLARTKNLARVNGLDWQQRKILTSELTSFTSAYAVNAVRGLIPVESIDGHQFTTHPIAWNLREFFQSDEIH